MYGTYLDGQRFRGGLVFKAHRLLHHSTLGLRIIKKKFFEGPVAAELMGGTFWKKDISLLGVEIAASARLVSSVFFFSLEASAFRFSSSACTRCSVNYFTEMCSGSEAGSYLRLIDFVYHSTLGLRVITKQKVFCTGPLRYRGTSLIRNRAPLGPYSRTIPRVIWWS